jgi:protein involved in polysaccharide export with SLBB domain
MLATAMLVCVGVSAVSAQERLADVQVPQRPPVVGAPTSPMPMQTAPEEADQVRAPLPMIGYDLFKVDVSKIEPGPIEDSYELSPGDEVHLRVWGQLQLTYELVVSPDQFLEIPEVPGRVAVGGLGLREVKERIRLHLATAYAIYFNLETPAASTAFIDVSLAKVRPLRFIVQGEVGRPGSYTLHPSLANVIYAIATAGGVKDSGTLRQIRIRRAGQTIDIDFYDFLIRGTMDPARLRILNGDVIFVPLKRKEVTIEGEVRRPGVYALHPLESEDLDTLLEFAGGVLPSASTDRVLIRRTELNVGQRTLSINLGAERASKRRVGLVDSDVVTVVRTNDMRRDFVELRGKGVLVPGEYQFTPGVRMIDLIKSAGGLAPEAFLDRAELRRTGSDMRETYTALNLRLANQGDPQHNVILQPLDTVTVFTVAEVRGLNGTVQLSGHVKLPGQVRLSDGMKLSDLLFARAGVQDQDFMRETYLPRGEISRVVAGSTARQLITFDLGKLLSGDAAQDRVLQADDEVRIFNRRDIVGTERVVTLSGYAKKTGAHPLLAGMRVSDVLKGPGGFEDPDFRRGAYLPRLDVLRPVARGDRMEKELRSVSLGALLGGDQSQDLILESGDEIVVYAAKDFTEPQFVDIAGAVNKPGQYELVANMTLADLIVRAGGLQDMADPATGDLFRVAVGTDGRATLETQQIPLTDLTLALKSRDRVLVRYRPGFEGARVVRVLGQVQFPGEYALSAGGRVADVIRMAGGLRDGAFLEGAALMRGPEDSARRVVFDLQRALDNASSPDNLLMFDGDRLSIPRQANTIRVEGEVRRPITIAWADGKGVGYYLDAAGGLTVDGDQNGVTIVLPNGRAAASRFLRGPDIRPGSTITVAAKPSPFRQLVQAAEQSAGAAPAGGTPVVAGSATTPTSVVTAADASAMPAPASTNNVAQGVVQNLGGACPTVAFDLGTLRVTTLESTTFNGVTCSTLKATDVVEITAVRVSDRVVVATEIRKR